MLPLTSALILCLVSKVVSGTSNCSSFDTCAGCAAGGCGWCSFVLGQGRCMGLGDGEFTCGQVYNTVPASTCWGHSTAGGQSGPGGGYYCKDDDGRCMPMFEGPTAPQFDSLSGCLNKCTPQSPKAPFYRCNMTSMQCEVSQTAGTSKEICAEQCYDRRLCSGGQCVSQGIDGAGDKVCPGECPQPMPGTNCSTLSSGGCNACVSADNRCGWCPYYKKCFDIAPHAPVFTCPPGFTTDKDTCTKSDIATIAV